mmetsp:Transcript_306/g.782  ORF Transcript_306/g.782 Transcript_306/m.782 type:complete len:218 (+) Transcript_306:347-1000(+)
MGARQGVPVVLQLAGGRHDDGGLGQALEGGAPVAKARLVRAALAGLPVPGLQLAVRVHDLRTDQNGANVLSVGPRVHVHRAAQRAGDAARKLQAGPGAPRGVQPQLVEVAARAKPEQPTAQILHEVHLINHHKTVKAAVIKEAVGATPNDPHRQLLRCRPPERRRQRLDVLHLQQIARRAAYRPAAVSRQRLRLEQPHGPLASRVVPPPVHSRTCLV